MRLLLKHSIHRGYVQLTDRSNGCILRILYIYMNTYIYLRIIEDSSITINKSQNRKYKFFVLKNILLVALLPNISDTHCLLENDNNLLSES